MRIYYDWEFLDDARNIKAIGDYLINAEYRTRQGPKQRQSR